MLSVIIITKNEARNIANCLQSVLWADEVIVLDSGSRDNTVAIAKQFTDKVFVNTDWQGYGVQKQRALSYAKGDWVLNLDADEVVSEPLKKAMVDVMQMDEAEAYRVPIQMSFYGKRLKYSSSPSRHIRLFKKDQATYSKDIVHEKVVMPEGARIARLKQTIEHSSFQDLAHALYKLNRYSSYSAKERLIKGHKKSSVSKALMSAAWMFLRCFILQRGFMDGQAGFVMATVNAQGALYRGLKQVFPDKQQDEFPYVSSD